MLLAKKFRSPFKITKWNHCCCCIRAVDLETLIKHNLDLRFGGLDFQAAEFVPNVTHSERTAMEEESRALYQEHYPNITNQGFEPAHEGSKS